MPHSSSLYRFQAAFETPGAAPATAPRNEVPCAAWRPIVAIGDGSEAARNAARRATHIGQSWAAPVQLLNVRNPSAVERAGLLVTHLEDGCRPFEWLFGSDVEQLVRRFSIPVLLVKQPANRRYRRALVGAQLDSQAGELVASARMLAPRAAVDVVHVLRTAHEYQSRLADAPAPAIRAQRMQTRRDAYRQLDQLVAAACANAANAITPRVVVGSAPDRLLEIGRAAGAGLIVLGKRRRHWLGEMLLDRGLVRRLLAEAKSDLLIVPARG